MDGGKRTSIMAITRDFGKMEIVMVTVFSIGHHPVIISVFGIMMKWTDTDVILVKTKI